MERLTSKMGWDIVEEEWPDFKGRIYKQRSRSLVEMLEKTVEKYPDHVRVHLGRCENDLQRI